MLSQPFVTKYCQVAKLKIEPFFYLYIASAVMLLPIRLVLAWLLAVLIHELSHYIALKVCKIEISNIRISVSGVIMQVNNLSGWKEAICALSGPAGGLFPLLLSRWLPCTAIFSFIHSCYNLLPMFSLDGGRVLKTALVKMLGARAGERTHFSVSCMLAGCLLVIGTFLFAYFNLPLWILLAIFSATVSNVMRKFPCKRRKQIVQ